MNNKIQDLNEQLINVIENILQAQNQSLDSPDDPYFQGANNTFIAKSCRSLIESNTGRTTHTRYYLPKVKIKGYCIMVYGGHFLDESVRNHRPMKTLEKLLHIKEMTMQLIWSKINIADKFY